MKTNVLISLKFILCLVHLFAVIVIVLFSDTSFDLGNTSGNISTSIQS
jgi:hypothetical protein